MEGDDTTQSGTTRSRHRATATSIPQEHAGRPQLVVLEGSKVGQTFPVQMETVIGRKLDATISLEDGEVSRRHAIIHRTDVEQFTIEDLASRNGTMVNGVPVNEPCELKLGDRIQLGSRVLLQLTRYEPIEDQLRHRQRLETLGRLAAGFAHDLNNMLAVITTNLDFLDGCGAVGDQSVMESLADIRNAAEHAARLTPRFLAFARPDERSVGPIDITTMCEEVAQVARRTFGSTIRVEVDIAAGLRSTGSITDLHQALMNLCINARDAMPDGGVLTITAALSSAAPSKQTQDRTERVVVRVHDDGQGMDETTQRRVFEPFFTTKSGGRGWGLGLATVRDTVRSHGGEISVNSSVGSGTAFTIQLPALAVDTHSSRDTLPPHDVPVPPPTRGRLLIVDDEVMVRRGMRRLLERHGFCILEAHSLDEGLSLYTSGDRPDAVIIDVDVRGEERRSEVVVEEIRRIDPKARIIVYSGDSSIVERHGDAVTWIQKPARIQQLLDVLARALKVAERG
jgi:signal transduction histidine kinase/CheY-like chemotaxis protein